MNIINKIVVLTSAIALLLFTACEKDPIDEIKPLNPIEVATQELSENPLIKGVGKMASDGFALECITFSYPFAFELESGDNLTINNNDEAEIALYNEDDYVIDFVYPIEATDKEGNIFIINNADELAEAFITCIPEDGWDDFEEEGFPAFDFEGLCVELSYPFSLHSYNEELTIEVNNEQEFAEALVSEYYYFLFPINVVDQEENTIAIEDDAALMNALFECDNYNGYYYNHCPFDFSFCFELVYPVGLIDEAGNISTVNNADDLYNLLFSGGAVDFVYPVSLISEDGTTIEANDANVIDELIDECFSFDYGDYPPFYYFDFCFAIDYPVDFTDATGNTHTANNEDELYERIYSGEVTNFVFPVTLIFEDGTTKTVNDLSELNAEIEVCYDYSYTSFHYPPFYYSYFCFTINYPVQWIDADENSSTADNEELLFEVIYSGEMVDLVYPITVTFEDGTIVTVNNADEINNLVTDCEYEEYPFEGYELNAVEIFNLLLTGESFCYNINYPITITVNNETQTIDEAAAIEEIKLELISNEMLTGATINYPITATLISDASTITINNDTEFVNFFENCP